MKIDVTHIEPASHGQVVQFGRDRSLGAAWHDCGPYKWRGEPVVCKTWRAAMLASAY